MFEHQSPMRILAVQRLRDDFGELLEVRAVISEFERSLLGTVFEYIWIEQPADYRAWCRRVRAAYYFLGKAFEEKNPKGVSSAFLTAADKMSFILMDIHEASGTHRQVMDSGKALEVGTLTYYKKLVEGPYRLLLAPIAYSFGKVMGSGDSSYVPDASGKVPLSVLKKIERLSIYPQSELTVGLNDHVRNSYSHENYRVLDDWTIELWDVDPRTQKLSWGPEVWHLDRLNLLCKELEQTLYAFVLALGIFSVNKRSVMTARGWLVNNPLPKLTLQELQRFLGYSANLLSFDFSGFGFIDGQVGLILTTRYPGSSQTEEILIGGDRHARRFKQRIEYRQVSLIAQTIGYLQRVRDYLNGYSSIRIQVQSYDDRSLGCLTVDVDALARFNGPSALPIMEARQLLSEDTLVDEEMSYREEGEVVEA